MRARGGEVRARSRTCVSAVPGGKLRSKPPLAARSHRWGELERKGELTVAGEQCGGLPYLGSKVHRPPLSVSNSESSCECGRRVEGVHSTA